MNLCDYIIIPVPGDGNCFFHSIVGFLSYDKKMGHLEKSKKLDTASSLRKKAVKWLRRNLEIVTPTGLKIKDEIEDYVNTNDDGVDDIEQYLNHMNKNKTYAGQIELYAISHLLNRNIKTFIKKKQKLISNRCLTYLTKAEIV